VTKYGFPPTPVKTPRQKRKQVLARVHSSRLLFPTGSGTSTSAEERKGQFDIFTDLANQEPVLDESLDNPFIDGRRFHSTLADPIKKSALSPPESGTMMFVL
jgi:hypothetical protein